MDSTEKSETLEQKVELASQCYKQGDKLSAWKKLAEVIRNKESLENLELLLESIYWSAHILCEKGKYRPALKLLQKGRAIPHDSEEKVKILVLIMSIIEAIKNPLEAVKVHQELEEICKRSPNLKGDSYPYSLYLACYYYLKLIEAGEIYHEEFRNIYRKLEKEYGDSYYFLWASFQKCYLVERNYDECIRILHLMLEYSNKNEKDAELQSTNAASWYYELALIHANYKYRKDPKLALDYLKRSLEIEPDRIDKKYVLILLARLNFEVGNYQEAIDVAQRYRKASRISQEEIVSILYNLRILAESYKHIGKRGKYKKLMREIFKKKPFSLLSLPFIPDKVWLEKTTFKGVFSE